MIYKAMGNAHAIAVSKGEMIRRTASVNSGQGTVEYVGLILLVSLLMVGMVAAMKFVPGRLATWLGSALGTDSVFLDDVDMRIRQAYLDRIRSN